MPDLVLRHFAWSAPAHVTRALLVLDGASNDEQWNVQCRIAQRAIDELPAGFHLELACLGMTQRVDRAAFRRDPAALRERVRDRVRLAGPVFGAESRDPCARLAVLAAGPVHDLADWVGSTVAGGVRFFPLAAAPVPAPFHASAADDAGVLAWLHDPVVSVRFEFGSGLPVEWNDPQWSLIAAGLECSSRNAALAGRPLAVSVLGPADLAARGTVTHASGRQAETTLPAAASGPAREWRPMDVRTAVVARGLAEGRAFECPHCGRTHRAGTVWCRTSPDSVLGRHLLLDDASAPELARYGGRGFLVFRAGGGGMQYRVHAGTTIARHPGGAARLEHGRCVALEFDSSRRCWAERDDVPAVFRVDEESHATAL